MHTFAPECIFRGASEVAGKPFDWGQKALKLINRQALVEVVKHYKHIYGVSCIVEDLEHHVLLPQLLVRLLQHFVLMPLNTALDADRHSLLCKPRRVYLVHYCMMNVAKLHES